MRTNLHHPGRSFVLQSAIPGFLAACALISQCALAAETATKPALPPTVSEAVGIEKTIDGALDLVGTRYRRGGESVETGFDCSGFVVHVFREGVGLELPRTTREISRTGEAVRKTELEPGDLVFFNTLRRAFSHVGIYLGDHLFAHAPRPGASVRVDDLRERYWVKRYNGARRITGR